MADNFLPLSVWSFFSNTTWWMMLAVAMAVATFPALLKSLRMVPLLLIAVLWIAVVISMFLTANIWATLAGAVISLLWGLLLMVLSLIFSGVRRMANQRYG
jgi:hypothetical protein